MLGHPVRLQACQQELLAQQGFTALWELFIRGPASPVLTNPKLQLQHLEPAFLAAPAKCVPLKALLQQEQHVMLASSAGDVLSRLILPASSQHRHLAVRWLLLLARLPAPAGQRTSGSAHRVTTAALELLVPQLVQRAQFSPQLAQSTRLPVSLVLLAPTVVQQVRLNQAVLVLEAISALQAPRRLQQQEQHAHEVTNAQRRPQTRSSVLQAPISQQKARKHATNAMLAPTASKEHLNSPTALRIIIARQARPSLSNILVRLVKARQQQRLQARSESMRVLV